MRPVSADHVRIYARKAMEYADAAASELEAGRGTPPSAQGWRHRFEVDPRRYGGWGYRGSLRLYRRAALNLRKGAGLRLELHDGRVFVVTVDDADTASQRMRPMLAAAARGPSGGS
jgi:hypothetical protein